MDSIVLFLNAFSIYGDDFSQPFGVQVHEVAEEMEDTAHYAGDYTPYMPEAIGSAIFNVSAFDTTRIDTTFRMRLADSFGQRILDRAKVDTTTFNDNDAFTDFIKGIAMVPDAANAAVLGIRVIADGQPRSFARLYYHNNEDTSSYGFSFLDFKTGTENRTLYYHYVDQDKSGTPLAGLEDNYTEYDAGNGQFYMQGVTGIMTKFSFQPLLNFIDTIDHLAVNRAELVFEVNEYPNYLLPPTAVELYIANSDNRLIGPLPDLNQNNRPPLQLRFRRDNEDNEGYYTTNLTFFAQDLISGISTDSVLMATPSLNEGSYFYRLNRMTGSNDKVKLKLFYSTLNN
jgi:hypothetical protein